MPHKVAPSFGTGEQIEGKRVDVLQERITCRQGVGAGFGVAQANTLNPAVILDVVCLPHHVRDRHRPFEIIVGNLLDLVCESLPQSRRKFVVFAAASWVLATMTWACAAATCA